MMQFQQLHQHQIEMDSLSSGNLCRVQSTVFHIHDCRGDYAYGASKGKGEVIKEEYFENCEWHIRALFEGEQRVEESQLKCEGVGQTKVSVSYHAVAEDWGEMADSEINVLDKYIEKEALHAMMAVLTKKQRMDKDHYGQPLVQI